MRTSKVKNTNKLSHKQKRPRKAKSKSRSNSDAVHHPEAFRNQIRDLIDSGTANDATKATLIALNIFIEGGDSRHGDLLTFTYNLIEQKFTNLHLFFKQLVEDSTDWDLVNNKPRNNLTTIPASWKVIKAKLEQDGIANYDHTKRPKNPNLAAREMSRKINSLEQDCKKIQDLSQKVYAGYLSHAQTKPALERAIYSLELSLKKLRKLRNQSY